MHIDIAGLPADRVVFATSPLAELGLALHALSEPGHHPGLHGWATATATALEPDLADRLLEAEFLWRNTFSDVFMPFSGIRGGDGRTGATLAEDLDLLDKLDDERFVAAALEFTCASHYGAGAPSPLNDAGMRGRALDLAAARGPQQMDFTRRLLADPASVRGWVRRLFEDCDQAFFADTWRRVSVQLVADARHKTELLRRKGLADAVGAVSAAVTLDESAGRINVDKLSEGRTTAVDPGVGRGLTLIPTSFGWPHLMVLHAPGWRPVIHYPVHLPDLRRPPPWNCSSCAWRRWPTRCGCGSAATWPAPRTPPASWPTPTASPPRGLPPPLHAQEGRAGHDAPPRPLRPAPAGPDGRRPARQRLPGGRPALSPRLPAGRSAPGLLSPRRRRPGPGPSRRRGRRPGPGRGGSAW